MHCSSQQKPLACSRVWRRARLLVVVAVLLAASLGLSACGTGSGELGDRIEVPSTPWVSLGAEEQAEIRAAINIALDPGAEAVDRAAAYLLVAEANLLLWDQLQKKLDALDETQGKAFDEMTRAGRVYFMQAHRARARGWAAQAEFTPAYVAGGVFERRFAEAWDHHQDPQRAFDELSVLLGNVLAARETQFVDVNFLSDLRYSTAIFYTLLDKPASDMQLALQICNNHEAEAVRFAGDVAYLYKQLVAKPDNAADAYRAIAASQPTTREGFEAQVEVLEALRKEQRLGAMSTGSADEFDTSAAGVELFRTVNRDIDMLAEINQHRATWKEPGAGGSNVEARAEDLVRSFAVRMHGLAQQQDNRSLYELAVSTYDKYHALFPTSGYRYEMLVFNAEALEHLGRHDDAYARYKEALGTSPQGTYREDIIRSLVMTAFQRGKSAPLPRSASETRIEMPEAHRDFIGSGEQFISVLGEKDPQMAGFVRYEIIKRHYLYGEVRVAEPLAEDFVKFDASHPQAPKAAVVLLDLLAREAARGGDREARALERAIERIRSTSALMRDEAVKQKLAAVSKTPPAFDGRVPD